MRAVTNLELVRSIYEQWERNDFRSNDWAHDDIEYVGADGPSAGAWTGKAALTAEFRHFLSAWNGWSVEAVEYRELDDARVLVPFQFTARGKRSGLELGQIRTTGASLFHLRGGRVSRLVQYMDLDRALADLGFGDP